MTDVIGVTGATGQLGRRVVRRLAERGAAQRLVVRDPSRAPTGPGITTAPGSYQDPDALRAAFDGVGTLFLVSAHEDPGRLALHVAAVEAAAAAGVERVVYTSFMGASPHASFSYARDHAHTERAIRDARMRLTALRDAMYAEYAPLLVGADGVIRGPAANGRVAWVARDDVARLAAAALLDPAHADRVYDVSGPEPLDLAETAAVVGEVVGRPIRYQPETLEEAWASRAGAEEWMIEGWVGSYVAIATGELGVTSHTIEHVTGRRPHSLAEALRAEPESWAHLVER